MKRLLPLCLLLATGCFRAIITTPSASTREGERVHLGASFLWGLTPTDTAAIECPAGVARVETYWPWWGPVVGLFTVGLVEPIEMHYWCTGGADGR